VGEDRNAKVDEGEVAWKIDMSYDGYCSGLAFWLSGAWGITRMVFPSIRAMIPREGSRIGLLACCIVLSPAMRESKREKSSRHAKTI
jgi:hypothetical protein